MPFNSNIDNFWRQKDWRIATTIIGFSLLVFGTLGVIFWPQLLDHIITKEMVLRPDSNVYRNWKIPPVNLVLDIYLFNWTNPGHFRDRATKPILIERGPYRFTENTDKIDIKWHPENASVSYRKLSYYKYNAAESNGNLDDRITSLNAVALTGASQAKNWDPVRRKMVDVGLIMYGQQLSITKTVDELLFSGYSDDMIDMARAVPIFGKDVEVPFDRFGWFYTRNGSADLTGVYTVFTGADNILKLGQMYSWNYKTHTGFYDAHCGLVNGSAGEFQPARLTKRSILQLFTPDLCRTISLQFKEVVEIEGIQGFKFVGDAHSVDNGSLDPKNKCFCGGECAQTGVINATSCRFGSPVFMSYPHFYQADKIYTEQVDGLEPKEQDHEFYIIVEPELGAVLEVAARFQVNMLVEPIRNITLFEDVPRIYFPLIWFEQKVRISPKLAANIRLLPLTFILGRVCFALMFAIGMTMVCWYPIKENCARCSSKGQKLSKSSAKSNDNSTKESNPLGKMDTTMASAEELDLKLTPTKSLLLELNSKLMPDVQKEEQENGSSF